MASVKFSNPSTIATPNGYTHIAEITGGRLAFLSGQVSFDKDGNMVGEGDFRAQTTQVFENLKAALEAIGSDFAHVAKINVYTTDVGQLPTFREVRDLYVNVGRPPASTFVGVTGLAVPGLLIEIEAVAVIPEG